MEKRLSQEMLEALVEIQFQLDKLEFEEMLEFLVCQVIRVLGVERCAVFRILPDEIAYLMAGEPKEEHGIGMRFSFSELEALKDVVNSKSYVLINDVWNDNRTKNTRELIYYKEIRAILYIPLMIKGEVVAVLSVDATKDKKTFTEEEIFFLQILANQASLLLERDLIYKEKKEKETLTILGQAAAEAAHKMRNPLVVIGGFARRLVKKLENSPFQKDALAIVEGVEKLEMVVNQLLEFSRPKRTNLLETDINEIIKKTKEMTLTLISQKNISIDCRLDPLPLIFVNPEEIKEVFSNILLNAVEAIREKGEILIKSRMKDGNIEVSITNSGGCIDEEIISQIFNPFFTTKPGGTGLGLAIAHAIVNAYGGEIRVENDKVLNLTTFIVRLPIREERR